MFLFRKINTDSYVRSTFILAIDMMVSLIASFVTVTLADILGLPGVGDRTFTIVWFLAAAVGSLLSFMLTRSYQGIIRYSTLRELATVCEASFAKELAVLACIAIFVPGFNSKLLWILPSFDLLLTLSGLVVVRIMMVLVYDFLKSVRNENDEYEEHPVQRKKVLVYGIGDKSVSVNTRLQNSSHYEVVGFIAPEGASDITTLMGKTIHYFGNLEDVVGIKHKSPFSGILFAYPADAKAEETRLIDFARYLNIKLYLAPTIDELGAGANFLGGIRDIKIEDLLGREEIEIRMDEVKDDLEGKVVLVTGAAGSIGSELCRQLATLGISRLIMLDNAETPLHNIRLEFEDKYKWVDFTPVIGDVRSAARMDFVFRHYCPDVVFHAAAYKHVPLMEENPCEAVMVNVVGTRNVADKCVEYGVKRMVMISTDKAVNPTNIMGCTKRLAEIYVQSLGLALQNGSVKGQTRFVTTRFGNVLGSNGSVIPRFKEQIASGGPITVTHPEICRFFMTIPEACRLVMEAAILARDTRIYVFEMGTPVKIADLAARMIHLAGYEVDKDIKIVYTGLRPGEKLYEEVLADKENTIPTQHKRIFQARVRQYEYAAACEAEEALRAFASNVQIDDMVKLMKKIVPEFKSRHSRFSVFDVEDTPAAQVAVEVTSMGQ